MLALRGVGGRAAVLHVVRTQPRGAARATDPIGVGGSGEWGVSEGSNPDQDRDPVPSPSPVGVSDRASDSGATMAPGAVLDPVDDPFVCPACGEQIGGGDYCGTCGLRLAGEEELGRRSQWQPRTQHPGRVIPGLRTDLNASSSARAPWHLVFPRRALLDPEMWHSGWARAFVFYAAAPLFFVAATANGNLVSLAWLLALYFAAVWFVVLRHLIRPEPLTRGLLAAVAAFTGVVGFAVAAAVEQSATPGAGVVPNLFVGVTEETAKLMPLLWTAFRLKRAYQPRTYMWLGVVSGLAFGVVEGVGYSAGVNIAVLGAGDVSGFVGLDFLRLVSDSVGHAAYAGIAGYFVGLGMLVPRSRTALIVAGLALAAVLHGSFDYFAGQGVWIAAFAQAAAFVIFAAYIWNGDAIADTLRALKPGGDPTRAQPAATPDATQAGGLGVMREDAPFSAVGVSMHNTEYGPDRGD